jgi:hypothetical protein
MKLRDSVMQVFATGLRVVRVLAIGGSFYHYFSGQMLHAIYWGVIALFLLMRQK